MDSVWEIMVRDWQGEHWKAQQPFTLLYHLFKNMYTNTNNNNIIIVYGELFEICELQEFAESKGWKLNAHVWGKDSTVA